MLTKMVTMLMRCKMQATLRATENLSLKIGESTLAHIMVSDVCRLHPDRAARTVTGLTQPVLGPWVGGVGLGWAMGMVGCGWVG